jgi:soluble lytic murein transglycosylase-like protein
MRDGIKCVVSTGVCDEAIWPYNELAYAQQPPDSCYAAAQSFKALSYFALDNSNIVELKTCLAAGFPFVFGFSIYPSFDSSNDGIVPMPGQDEPLEGGHAVMAVGYDDPTKRFIVQNSWGPDKGDHGYYHMPYDYLNSKLSDSFWTVRNVTEPAAASVTARSQPVGAPAATAAVAGLANQLVTELTRDMAEAKKYLGFIKEAVTKYGNLTPSLVCALGSRESNWGLSPEMRPNGPTGTGDWAPRDPKRFGYAMPPDGLGWGRGLLQIDYQQTFAQTGKWNDPEANILYGATELSGNIAYFSKSAAAKGVDLVRAGVAAYNCGRGGVTNALKQNKDVDFYTAGKNYSQDVLNRKAWFQQQGFDQLV